MSHGPAREQGGGHWEHRFARAALLGTDDRRLIRCYVALMVGVVLALPLAYLTVLPWWRVCVLQLVPVAVAAVAGRGLWRIPRLRFLLYWSAGILTLAAAASSHSLPLPLLLGAAGVAATVLADRASRRARTTGGFDNARAEESLRRRTGRGRG